MVFDVKNYETFEELTYWMEEIKKNCNKSKIGLILVGNKNDELSVTIFNTIKKESRQNVAQKAILDNYINSINIGFDNIKEYDDYNKINEEKDEDSDNENDKLECEPVPSFILCIQKKEK